MLWLASAAGRISHVLQIFLAFVRVSCIFLLHLTDRAAGRIVEFFRVGIQYIPIFADLISRFSQCFSHDSSCHSRLSLRRSSHNSGCHKRLSFWRSSHNSGCHSRLSFWWSGYYSGYRGCFCFMFSLFGFGYMYHGSSCKRCRFVEHLLPVQLQRTSNHGKSRQSCRTV